MGARGAVVGLTRGSNWKILVRATLESLAYQTRDVVESMERDSGLRLRALRVDGGAASNDWLMQFQADLLGIPVLRPPMVASTGKGAGLLAGIGIGWWKPQDAVRFSGHPERAFRPRMSPAERDRRYDGWRAAVSRVRSRGGP
jgi:glycerol kinase